MTSLILDIHLTLKNEMTMNDILLQCQDICPKLLCVIKNNLGEEKVQIYKKLEEIPKNLTYLHNTNNCYYFKDDQNTYTIFGLSAAQLFYPDLKTPEVNGFLKPVFNNHIIVYEDGHKHIFPYYDNQLIIKSINIFNF